MNLTAFLGLTKPEEGENYDIDVFNNNADLIDAAIRDVTKIPMGKGLSTGHAVPNAATTIMNLSSTDYESQIDVDAVANNIVIAVTGIYRVVASCSFAGTDDDGYRSLSIYKNGNVQKRTTVRAANSGVNEATELTLVDELQLITGDTIDCRVLQTSGAALNLIDTFGPSSNSLSCNYVGKI